MSKTPVNGFKEGASGNPAGRPPLPENASALRPLRSKLRGLSPKALKAIEASVNDTLLDGKPVTKEQLMSCKWVVNTLVTVHKTIVTEETGSSVKDEDDEVLDVEETKTKLSLVMVN